MTRYIYMYMIHFYTNPNKYTYTCICIQLGIENQFVNEMKTEVCSVYFSISLMEFVEIE